MVVSSELSSSSEELQAQHLLAASSVLDHANLSCFPSSFDRTYEDPRIVWSANRNRHVLEFSKNRDLLLRDFDGTTVWSTDTSGKSVVRMDVNEAGSLVIFDDKNKTVWSSMDYSTDSLVLGQSLKPGQRLTANISVTNSSQGPLYLSIANDGFQAFVGVLENGDPSG